MKILFIVPPYRTTDALVAQLFPMPLGAVMLATVLNKAGHDASIKDFLIPAQTHKVESPAIFKGKHAPPYIHYGQSEVECRAWIRENVKQYDAVGLCAGQCNLYEGAAIVADEVNKCGVPLVVGGPYVTTATPQAMKRFGAAVAVKGEGEGVVVQAFERAIAGAAGEIIEGQEMAMEDLPLPDWSLAPPKYYLPHKGRVRGVLTISRGCPFQCKFCSVWTIMGRRHRRLDKERIYHEIVNLAKHDVSYFCFLDDNLFLGEKETEELLEAIRLFKSASKTFKKAKFYLEEGMEVRVAAMPGLVQRVMEAGFENLALGIETVNDGRAQEYQKPYDEAQLKAAIKECDAAKNKAKAFYIVGFPGDTIASVCADLVEFGKLGLAVRPNNLKLYPGTEVTRMFLEHGWIDEKYDWRLSSFFTPQSGALTFKEMRQLKTILGAIGFAAEQFDVRVFKDDLEVIKQKIEAKGYDLEFLPYSVTLRGNMFRPTPYRKLAELLLLRQGAGYASSVIKEGSVIANHEDEPPNEVQRVLRAAILGEEINKEVEVKEEINMNVDEEGGPSEATRPKEQPSLWADFDEQRMVAIKKNLEDRFVVPPFSVLDTRQGYWQDGKRLWLELGIKSEVGRETGTDTEAEDFDGIRSGKKGACAFDGQIRLNAIMGGKGFGSGVSVFDPVICELMYKWFCPPGGTVLDPFAGGSVRGIVAEYLGYKYIGIELRPEQVEANNAQAAAIKLDPTWIVGDSEAELERISDKVDFIFSCPPYFDLEIYSDLPGELSAIETYEGFLEKYARIIANAVAHLRPNRFACFVVSNFRNQRNGYFRNFVADTADAFGEAKMWLYNEAVLVNSIGTLPVRIGRQFVASRKLGKCHQNVLVFYNGDQKTIKKEFPQEV